MKKYKIGIEEKKFFIDKLCSNIIIQEYFSYDELFMKVMELNILYEEHKLKNIGLIIIDGLNSITPRKLEISEKVNGRGYNLKFYGYEKRISNENNLMGRRQQKTENNDTADFIKHTEYKIVGVIDSPMYITYSRGNSTVGNGSVLFYMMIKPEEFSVERYTNVYVRTKASSSGLSDFSEEYSNMVNRHKKDIEGISDICVHRFN